MQNVDHLIRDIGMPMSHSGLSRVLLRDESENRSQESCDGREDASVKKLLLWFEKVKSRRNSEEDNPM